MSLKPLQINDLQGFFNLGGRYGGRFYMHRIEKLKRYIWCPCVKNNSVIMKKRTYKDWWEGKVYFEICALNYNVNY